MVGFLFFKSPSVDLGTDYESEFDDADASCSQRLERASFNDDLASRITSGLDNLASDSSLFAAIERGASWLCGIMSHKSMI